MDSTVFRRQLYHEGCVATLLELMLYHQAACESLADALVDLIDYCHRTLTTLIAGHDDDAAAAAASVATPAGHPSLRHLDVARLERSIAIRCISILRYVTGHAEGSADLCLFLFLFFFFK